MASIWLSSKLELEVEDGKMAKARDTMLDETIWGEINGWI